MLDAAHIAPWTRAAALALLGAALLYAYLRWFERANVWIPMKTLTGTPADAGLPYEDVFLTSDDGVRIHAWWIPREDALASLLFCHGNAGNVSSRLESIRLFHSLGLNVFIFDYRGYGQSGGRPSEEGTYRDAGAARSWVMGKTPDSPLVLFGRSLGAAVAAELAADGEGGDALIFESGFTSVGDIGSELFPFLPVRWIQTIQYDSLAKIPEVKMPVMVIHSPEDEIIPFHHGERIFEAANPPKEFLTIRGSHNGGYLESGELYTAGIAGFIQSHVAGG